MKRGELMGKDMDRRFVGMVQVVPGKDTELYVG
jgi:hypothetical protein